LKEGKETGPYLETSQGLNWEAARDEIGVQVLVVIDEYAKVIQSMARDEISMQLVGSKGKFDRLPFIGQRDKIDSSGVPP
jgi:hypothetical protein